MTLSCRIRTTIFYEEYENKHYRLKLGFLAQQYLETPITLCDIAVQRSHNHISCISANVAYLPHAEKVKPQ
jgi:hypothetical protein